MINSLQAQIARTANTNDFPLAENIERNIPLYDCSARSDADPSALKAELAANLLSGPGVFVLRNAFADTTPVDEATAVFLDTIEREKKTK